VPAFDVTRWRWNLVGAIGCALQLAVLTASAAYTGTLDRTMTLALTGAALLWAAAVVTCLLTDRSGRTFPTLVWPFLACASLAAAACADSTATSTFPGMLTVCFGFIGLTQPPRRAWILAPFALPTLGVAMDMEPLQFAVRGPLTVIMWLLVAELPAQLLSRLRQQEDELRRLASTDRLTGLLNRHALEDALQCTTRHDAVVLLDLDGFKEHNDRLGHVAGDALLSAFGAMLRRECSGGQWYRYGGDEFLGIFARTSLADARHVVDGLKAVKGDPPFSTGVATGGPLALTDADQDLYRAKRER
jgi:GGDEF domain-containing protein